MLRPIAILLLIPAFAFGTLPATTVWEIRTDGSPTNGGGYKSNAGTTDYSQQAAAQLSRTDLACASNTTLTSATGGFTAAMVGNIVCIVSGTNALAGWYEITAYTDTNTVTIDRTCATGGNMTDGVGNVGGALKCLGDLGVVFQTAAQSVAGMKAYLRNTGTDYTLDTATANTAATTGYGGPLDLDASQMDSKSFYIKGYDPSQGRDSFSGTRPRIDAGSVAPTNMLLIKGTAVNEHLVCFLTIDGNSQAVNGFRGSSSSFDRVEYCSAIDCDGSYGFYNLTTTYCFASSCAANGFQTVYAHFCSADSCENGFADVNFGISFCVASNNSSVGFQTTGYTRCVNCVSYNNGSDGFDAPRSSVFINCISYSDGAYSWDTAGSTTASLYHCASDGATSGRTDAAIIVDHNPVVLTADPFTNAAAGDFSLNNTAGGGALLRAAGISPYGQTGYLDIGAVQHADPAASGGETSHVWVR